MQISELRPDARVGGLHVERELGRGAFGVVYLAHDLLIGRPVALKVIAPSAGPGSANLRAQVLTEARLVGRLSTPHVVTLYRVHCTDDGGWVLEMEYVGGGSLEALLSGGRRLSPSEAVPVLAGLLRALEAAHDARIVHGDVKPANLLFAEDGTPKLADFGIARMLGAGGVAQREDGHVAGTPYYMAPEVVLGQGARRASDLWSAGVVAYETLAGRLPFDRPVLGDLFRAILEEPIPTLPDDVPGPLRGLVAQLLTRDADARQSTAGDVLRSLERAVTTDTVLATAAGVRVPPPTNLARGAAPIVGRAAEVADVGALVTDPAIRLVTVTGPGGMGKTRLAREVGHSLLDQFPGGVWFADLSDVRDAHGLAQVVATVLSVPPDPRRDPVQLVGEVLSFRRPLLLVLDNFEQVADAAPATVGAWSRAAPACSFLVTSRAVLGLEGERTFEVGPMSVPPAGRALSVDEMTAFDAMRLFAERASEGRPAFRIDAANAADVAHICRELDGMPLAIELAAARIRLLTPAQIAENLGRKLQLLASPRRDTVRRQSTLRGAIEWSFDLLQPWEQDAFLQACCFRDGFSVESFERIADLSSHADAPLALDVVQSLRDKSLLIARDVGQTTRLAMYAAIREFGTDAWARTADADRRRALLRRHAEHFVELAERWNAGEGGARAAESLERLGPELGNLQLARETAVAVGEVGLAVRAALASAEAVGVHRPPRDLLELATGPLDALRDSGGGARARLLAYRSEGLERLGDWAGAADAAESAVAAARASDDPAALAAALLRAGEIRRNRGSYAGALEAWMECERLAEAVGARPLIARSVGDRGMVLLQQGMPSQAMDCFVAAERTAREIGDMQTAALNVGNRGVVLESRGAKDAALACHREAEDMGRRVGDRLRVAVALGNQANVLVQMGDLEAAARCYDDAERIARDLGARQRIAQIVSNRGMLHAMRGELDEALGRYVEAEGLSRALGDRHRTAITLVQKASVLARREMSDEALACLAEAVAIARGLGDRPLEARALCSRGMLLADLQRTDEAWESLRSGVAIYDAMGSNRSMWYFSFAASLAPLAIARGETAEGLRRAATCLDLARRIGVSETHPDPQIRDDLARCRAIVADHWRSRHPVPRAGEPAP